MPEAMTRTRWWILTLLFFITTNNYLDRIILGFLAPAMQKEVGFNDQEYGYITAAFQIAYALGFLAFGKFIDARGARLGYAVAIVWWSFAAAGHALARNAWHLGFWRATLGLGESGNFPAAIKAVAEWFPKKDRAFATGIFNAGTNVATMIGPQLFAWLYMHFGWQTCFLLTASTGTLCFLFWWFYYRLPSEHRSVNSAELAYIQSDPEEAQQASIGWMEAMSHKQAWAFAMAKFFTDPVWWFYLNWLTLYFVKERGLKLTEAAWALPVIYLMADFGSVFGGWFSGFLMKRGWPVARARKWTMALCALCMPIAASAVFAPNVVVATLLICFATAGHQGWSANLYTTTSDVFPKAAVASVTGIGGFAGGIGGFLFSSLLAGYIVQHFGYVPIFVIMGTFHLIAFGLLHFMMGDLAPISDRPAAKA
jgi:ACS family hexuronate transporter-like MFS transporter